MQENMEAEVSLYELWQLFSKHIIKIVAITIIGSLIAVMYMMLFVDKEYQSQAQLLVNQNNTNQEATMQYSEIQSNVYLVNTYRDIIQGLAVIQSVSENMDGDYTVEELSQAITVEQSPDSQAFYVSAIMGTPEEAQSVVNTVISEFEKTLTELYDEENSSVYIVSPATYKPNPISPGLPLYALIGGMLGFIVIIGIILVTELMDTRIKSVEEASKSGLIHLGDVYGLTEKQVKANRYRMEVTEYNERKRV